MEYVAGAVFVLVILGAMLAGIGEALLAHMPGWLLWLLPFDPNSIAAKLAVGGFVIGVGVVLLMMFAESNPTTPEEQRQIDQDAHEFAWWMTEGPGSYR